MTQDEHGCRRLFEIFTRGSPIPFPGPSFGPDLDPRRAPRRQPSAETQVFAARYRSLEFGCEAFHVDLVPESAGHGRHP